MCADCSHGSPDTAHRHPQVHGSQTLIGLAGAEPELRRCLTEWQRTRPGIQLIDLQKLWP
jgi:hypothetical protein